MKDMQSRQQPLTPYYFDALFDDFDRVTNGVFGNVFGASPIVRRASSFLPSYELVENEQGYLLSFDLPGVPKEDIQIEVREQQLRVFGERKREESKTENKNFFTERRYGRFERAFTLPADVDADRIQAHHQDGLLQLMLPKAEKSYPKSIKIESGQGNGFFSKLINRKDESAQ